MRDVRAKLRPRFLAVKFEKKLVCLHSVLSYRGYGLKAKIFWFSSDACLVREKPAENDEAKYG